MAVDYVAIHTEVTTGTQYAAAYAAKDVNGIQAIYNSVTAVGQLDLGLIDIYLKSHNVLSTDSTPAYWSLKAKAAGTTQPQAQLAEMVLDLFTSRLSSVDFSLAVVTNLLGQCVTAGVLSAQNQADLIAMATQPRNVSVQDLAFALYNPDGSVK